MGNYQCCSPREDFSPLNENDTLMDQLIDESKKQGKDLLGKHPYYPEIAKFSKFYRYELINRMIKFPNLSRCNQSLRNFLRSTPIQNEEVLNILILIFEKNLNKCQFYKILRDDIQQSKNSYFYLIVNSYQKFMEKLLSEYIMEDEYSTFQNSQNISYDKYKSNKQIMNQSLLKRQSSTQGLTSQESILDISGLRSEDIERIFKDRSELVEILIQQLVGIFKMLKVYLQEYYSEVLQIIYQREDFDLPQYLMLIQRLLQHFLLMQGTIIQKMLPILLTQWYENQRTIQKKTDSEIFNLKESLVPKDDSYVAQFPQIFKCSYGSSEQEWFVKNGQYDGPYSQTFNLLEELSRKEKLCHKYQLIVELDKMIIDLFMHRQEDVIKKYDLISAEDNKVEIVIYLLQRFKKEEGREKLRKSIYYPIKFMMDFDEILDSQIKYIYQPAFIRFYSICEMIVL